jgi:hypothetical protein
MNSNRITSLGNPSLSTDAVNVAHVANNYVPFTGGTMSGAILASGFGASSTGTLSSVTIAADGSISGITSTTSAIVTTGGNIFVSALTYTGSLIKNQRITLFNSTSGELYVGHNCASGNGRIICLPHTVITCNSFINLIFDDINSVFVVENQNPALVLNTLYNYQWTGDKILNMLLNTNRTFKVKLNFMNSTSTINSVTGFQNVGTTNGSFTNCSISYVGGAVSSSTSVQSAFLTDTESAKFAGIVFNHTSMTITCTNLSYGHYYQLLNFALVWDTTESQREFIFQDLNIQSFTRIVQQQMFTKNTSNSPATITSYVFRKECYTDPSFKFTNNGGQHLYGMVLIDLGTSMT